MSAMDAGAIKPAGDLAGDLPGMAGPSEATREVDAGEAASGEATTGAVESDAAAPAEVGSDRSAGPGSVESGVTAQEAVGSSASPEATASPTADPAAPSTTATSTGLDAGTLAGMGLPVGRSDAAPTAEDLAALAAAAIAARPMAPPVVPGDAGTTTDPAPGTALTPSRLSRARFRAGALRVGTWLLAIGLFIGGIAIGNALFVRTQPPAPLIGDVSTGGVATPPVVVELTRALASNDADALRSAVSGDPYRLLAGELQSWNLQGVTSVETLATMQDGPRSATEIVVLGRTADGQPVVFNLVVHVTDNRIVNFR